MQPGRIAYGIDRRGARNAVAFHFMLATGFVVFGAVGWGMPSSGAQGPDGWRVTVAIVAVAGAAIFGWIAVRFLERLRSDAPLFMLDPKGLYDNGSVVFSGIGWIAWGEIEDVRVGRYHSLPCVELVLADRDRVLARVPWIERVGRSARLGYPAVAFRGPLLPDEPARLVEQIRAYVRTLSAGEA